MEENTEAMETLFEDEGINATSEQIKNITDAFIIHLELMEEMKSYQHVGRKDCEECIKLKTELKRMKYFMKNNKT
jgi:hypothetical protein